LAALATTLYCVVLYIANPAMSAVAFIVPVSAYIPQAITGFATPVR
jgi:hypothetical protein